MDLDYKEILQNAKNILVKGIPNQGNLCNVLNLLKSECGLFWIGVYKWMPENQYLGLHCFAGLPACTIIKSGKGVCGTAYAKNETVIVPDVSLFDGYIACHSEAKSEIVTVGKNNGNTYFVLDVDSVELNAFGLIEKEFYEQITELITPFI